MPCAAASQLQSPDADVTAVLRRSAELDASVVGLLRAIPDGPRDLDVVYLPGLDITQHGERGYIMGIGELMGGHESSDSMPPLSAMASEPMGAKQHASV